MKDKSRGCRLQHIWGRDSKYSSGADKEAIQRKCKFIKVLKLPPLCSFDLIFPGLTALKWLFPPLPPIGTQLESLVLKSSSVVRTERGYELKWLGFEFRIDSTTSIISFQLRSFLSFLRSRLPFLPRRAELCVEFGDKDFCLPGLALTTKLISQKTRVWIQLGSWRWKAGALSFKSSSLNMSLKVRLRAEGTALFPQANPGESRWLFTGGQLALSIPN